MRVRMILAMLVAIPLTALVDAQDRRKGTREAKMKQRLVFILIVTLGVPAVWAQSTSSAAQAELIQTLLARIDTLERRVTQLERLRETSGEVATTTAQQAAEAVQLQAILADAMPSYPSLRIAGFSDVNFSATDQPGSNSGFRDGQFVLHFTSPLSPRVSFFSELTFSGRADAGTGSPRAAGFNPEIERTIIRYDQSDQFKVSFGRYHSFINWWNTAFHHGLWLQTTIANPAMLGTIVPRHLVGGMIEGTFPAQGLNIGYNLGLGNGRGSVLSRAGDVGDINSQRAWMFNLFSKPDRFFGLQAGGSFYRDKIALADGRDFREWIASGHFVWGREDPELIAEFANVNHREVGLTETFNTQTFYIQAAYRLPWFEQLWKPYYRFDYTDLAESDPVFQALRSLRGSSLGMRYDISNFAAFKLEYRHQRRPGQSNVNGIFLQNSFTF